MWYIDPIDGSSKEDSTLISNGQFSFKGKIETPFKATLFTGPSYNSVTVYLVPGVVQVMSADSLDNAIIRGGPLNEDNNQLRTLLKPATKKKNQLYQEYRTALAALPDKKPTKEFEAVGDKKIEALEAEEKPIYTQFIRQKPNSPVSIDAIRSLVGYKPDVTVAKPLFNGLSASVRNSPVGKNYARELAKLEQVAVGAVAPDFTQSDTLGKAVSLQDFKGKYVLIDFWASWCGPCVKSFPGMQKAVEKYKADPNVAFVFVNTWQSEPDKQKNAADFIAKKQYPFNVLLDEKDDVVAAYGVSGIPTKFIIDKTGTIRFKEIGFPGGDDAMVDAISMMIDLANESAN